MCMQPAPQEAPARSRFRRVLCAVDGSRASIEATEQACKLVDPAGSLTFLAVSDARGTGATAQATLGEDHAERAVDAARRSAGEKGLGADGAVVIADMPARAILAAAEDHDLLVLGGHNRSRAAGIMLGSTATLALHEAAVPVLVARQQPAVKFPGVILAAVDGDAEPALVAATLAADHGGHVVLTHVGEPKTSSRHLLAEQSTAVLEITGVEPVVLSMPGDPAERLPAVARSIVPGLLVMGSSGKTGLRALASVSERVAHRAPCSVLVLRG